MDIPEPTPGPTEVLVRTTRSLISSGTERAVRQLASASLLEKAKARPDLVRQVMRKAKSDGLKATYRAVNARLEDQMPLGYSATGIVVSVGEAVAGVRVGQRVATGGAGHGEMQIVAGNLVVAVPDGVSDDDAAFATVGSIAMHGLRMLELSPGACVCVVGLGLIGQIAARIAKASGYRVAGIDLDPAAVEMAKGIGVFALRDEGDSTTGAILEWSRGRGVDGSLVTAATKSSEPVLRATKIARDRSDIVVVGDVGLELDRRPFYDKELSVKFARSYGPGRYERAYEEWGVDYPASQVRWTEGRNLEAVLDLIDGGGLQVSDLVTHRFTFDNAPKAYALLENKSERAVGVLLEYAAELKASAPVVRAPSSTTPTGKGIGLFGAGNFAKGVLLPAFKAAGLTDFAAVCTPSGISARALADREGFRSVYTKPEELLADPGVSIVVVASPHDSHAELVTMALRAGKHVFCEKPLALTMDELDTIEAAWKDSGTHLFIGFNRRFSPAVAKAKRVFGPSGSPLTMTYRVSAGALDPKHWYHDRRQGGRLIGEVCHFIDTCAAVAQSEIVDVSAHGGGLHNETLLTEDLVVGLRFANGSVAAITYSAGGHPSGTKERFEILGRGHTVEIDDYRTVTVDGKSETAKVQDKGHNGEVMTFADLCEGANFSLSQEIVLVARWTMLAIGEASHFKTTAVYEFR